jgi:hypothetical protein
MSRINVPWWLLHVDIFFKDPVKKIILRIQLPKTPFSSDSSGEDDTNHIYLHHRAKGILIVNPVPLFEAFRDQSGLVSINGSIRLVLDFEYPFAIHQVMRLMCQHQMPSHVLHKRIILSIHNLLPIHIG